MKIVLAVTTSHVLKLETKDITEANFQTPVHERILPQSGKRNFFYDIVKPPIIGQPEWWTPPNNGQIVEVRN